MSTTTTDSDVVEDHEVMKVVRVYQFWLISRLFNLKNNFYWLFNLYN